MTIKQNGGIFGRNPTFNDVTIEGELTFDGDIDVNSDLKVSGDLEVLGDITVNSSPFPEVILKDADLSNVYGRIYSASGNTAIESDVTNQQAGSSLILTVDGDTKAQISSGGNLTVNNGNLVIGTSGKGIDFSATSGTGTSELFDDYEEGTWTPTLIGTTSGSATVSVTSANYTKIGNVVHLFAHINADLSSHNIVGAVDIGGLPFSVSATNNGGGTASYNAFVNGIVLFRPVTSTLRLTKGTSASWQSTDLASGASALMMLQATYRTA
jgi:hypothetical protein